MRKIALKLIKRLVAKHDVKPYELFSNVSALEKQVQELQTHIKETPDIKHVESIFVKGSNALARDLEGFSGRMVDFGTDVVGVRRDLDGVKERSVSNLAVAKQVLSNIETLVESLNLLGSLAGQLASAQKVIGDAAQTTAAIDEIVLQTRILSFNADTEAARAGEAGKSFAVIAKSIRDLAKDTGKFSLDIEAAMHNSVNVIRDVTSSLGKIQEDYKKMVSASSESIRMMVSEIHVSSDSLVNVNQQLENTCSGLQQIVAGVRQKVEDNSAFVSEIIGELRGCPIIHVSPRKAFEVIHTFQVIDVRRDAEYCDELGHIENSTLVTIGDNFKERIQGFDKDAPVLFICRSGGRSARAARIGQEIGFKKVYNLEGGMLAWRKEGLPSLERRLKKSA